MKYERIHPRALGAFVGIIAWVTLSLLPGQSMPVAAQGGGEIRTVDIPNVLPHEFRGDVRDLPQIPSKPKFELELREPQDGKPAPSGPALTSGNLAVAAMPAVTHNFAGLSYNSSCTGGQCGAGIPPDTNGDVGPRHYIQAVNSAFAIYNKSGTRLAAFTEDALFAGSAARTGKCDGHSQGDPVVLYDQLANRWILTNFAFSVNAFGYPIAPFYQCIAVSKSGDPVAGGWWLYGLRTDTGLSGQPPTGTINDYPKFGIWTDCLYYAANGFNLSGSYVGGEFGSFSRTNMYSGAGLTGAFGFAASSNDYFTMIPSNLSAPGAAGLPPSGTPNYFVHESLTVWSFKVRKFTPGTNCSAGSLGAATEVTQANYTVPASNIVPQPNTGTKLDSIGDRLLQKVQYRRVGSAESLWVTHTFRSSSGGPTGQQWAQINVTGGSISTTAVQQQLYDPGDGLYRWMGSIAADRRGNAAIAYSISGSSSPNFPSIAYAGRLASDPLNQLPQGEAKLVTGAGSQVNNCGGAPCHRWGDYSSMSIDPVDGCTFWFTNEYYASQTAGNSGAWNTRIGSFKFPSCSGTQTFRSTGAEDGWVLESGEATNTGGSLNATATTFRLGDDANNRQFRAILSFDTSGLPDNAVISSVVLKIKKQGLAGSNPFSSLGNISVDLRNGAFNNNPALETADFQAPADQSAAMTITNNPSSGWYSRSLSASYFNLISLTGTTQFRLRFATDDNNNHVADYLLFYSGNFSTSTNRPTLVIKYSLP